MQQAIINAVTTQINPQTNRHPAHPFSGDLDFGCIRHRSALASTKLSCNAMIIDKAEILLHSFTPNNEQSMMSVSSNASSADASKDS